MGPDRGPTESPAEDLREFAEEGPNGSGFGIRIAKEEGWVRLVLKGHAKTDGYLTLQATNLTDFEFSNAQRALLAPVNNATSERVDGAAILFEQEVKAGTPVGPLEFYARVTAAGATNEGMGMAIGQFQAKKRATDGEDGNAIDKGLIKVEQDIDFDFTKDMLLDPATQKHFIFPCIALCGEGKMFLRYKTGARQNITNIAFKIEDKNQQIVWEHTDQPSANWKPIFPECRANKDGSKDLGDNPYKIGEKWKYLDPGKNGDVPEGPLANHEHYPPRTSAYKATMTVSFNGGGADVVRTLDFDVRSRDILIARTDDSEFGVMAEAAVRKLWASDPKGLDAFASEVSAPNGVLALAYQRSDFRAAFKALTPRGRLVTVNHGYANFGGRATIDGRSRFGGIGVEGPTPGDSRPGFGLGTDYESPSDSKPVDISDLLEPYGAFVDLAHCFTAHHSDWDDSDASVNQSFAVAANGGVASAKARGYVGECRMFVPSWEVTAIFTIRKVSRERLSLIRAVAIHNLLKPHMAELGIVNQVTLRQGVMYTIDGHWAANGGDYSLVQLKLRQYLAANLLQAEVEKLLAPGEGPVTLEKPVSISLSGGFAKPTAVVGDDEGAPKTLVRQAPRVGEDVDADVNPSSSLDDPAKPDDPFPLITVAP